MKKNFFTLLFFSAFAISSYAQNLIKNSNFSKGVEDWSIFLVNGGAAPRMIEVSNDYKKYGLADNQAGLHFAELDAQSAIQQTITTVEGKDYLLGFGFATRPNAGDKQLIVEVNGKAVFTQTFKNNVEAGKFTHSHFSFTADAATSKIAFYIVSLSGKDDEGLLVSDVLCNLESEVDLKLFYTY
jgi:hypothetical protein